MKQGRLLAVSVLLAILAGLFWWLNKREASATKPPVTPASTKIVDVPLDQIESLNIEKLGSEPIELKRTGSKWSITGPKALPADQEAVSSLVSTFASLNSDKLLEDHATSVDQYGLKKPSLSVTATKKDGKTVELLVGDETPTNSGSYAELAGDRRVFIVASYNKNSLDKSFNDLRDKRLLTFDSEKLSRVELTAKKDSIEFGRNKDQWQILKPKPMRANQSAVENLVRSLGDAKMELSATDDEKKDLNAFNAGKPVAIAKISDLAGTQELQVRKNKDDFYAKSSAVAGVYKVLSSVGSSVDKSLDDFRNKKLFDFGFVDPEKIEIHDGAKSYFLTRNGSDWWSNGTKMDESTVSALVSDIRDLTATKFPDSGFAASSLDMTVTSDSGKRVEKVLIAKNGDRYIAKRENEPALYELTASTITDLQKAAGDVKPAPPPAPAASPKKK
ncbi:MAG TPA: DUF4340 domain-containing protein [Candidatus Acidoferrum sp.]|nr:DUF4340 domain-containing protein [Candidatus Acidoferrum sp.]